MLTEANQYQIRFRMIARRLEFEVLQGKKQNWTGQLSEGLYTVPGMELA